MSGPSQWKIKEKKPFPVITYTKWSFVNAESSTLSVSEVDNNSDCQTEEVKEKKVQ